MIKKVLLGAAALIVVLLGGGATFVYGARPLARPASTEVVERTPERLARGKHLFEDVAMCAHCHSLHENGKLGLPIVPGKLGAGGMTVDQEVGFPGSVTPPNLTPDVETGLGAWTDGEIIRAIREGVSKDGRALFPMMPYKMLREQLPLDDARALVVYLRSLPPVRTPRKPIELPFPLPIIARLSPAPVDVEPEPVDDARDHLAYGKRLVALMECVGCHSQFDKGQVIPGTEYGGGREFLMPGPQGKARVITANISTDPETGYFGKATKDAFLARVRSWNALGDGLPDAPRGTQTIMPWLELSRMSDQELSAIYDFMKTVPPVKHVVDPFPDAPQQAVARAP